jgi:hypothetical protein
VASLQHAEAAHRCELARTFLEMKRVEEAREEGRRGVEQFRECGDIPAAEQWELRLAAARGD